MLLVTNVIDEWLPNTDLGHLREVPASNRAERRTWNTPRPYVVPSGTCQPFWSAAP